MSTKSCSNSDLFEIIINKLNEANDQLQGLSDKLYHHLDETAASHSNFNHQFKKAIRPA